MIFIESNIRNQNKKGYVTARFDRVFKAIFCDEDDLALFQEFLTRLLGKKVEHIKLLQNELPVRTTKEKVKTVDVFALVDDEYTHIELNTEATEYIRFRNFNYFTTLFNKKTLRGEEYDPSIKFIHFDFSYGLGRNTPLKREYTVTYLEDGTSYVNHFKIVEYNMDKLYYFWYHKDKS